MIGQTLSHFKITAKLGEGGMGEVYRAEDTKLGREVALKVLPEAFTEDPERFARFEREAHLLASLNHPNIAAIYDLAEDQGTHFLVLELVEGEDLAARTSRGPVPVENALALALQIAEALEAAHDKGIVHRDLKPANVMVGPNGAVKVLDFGLAKAWEPESRDADLTQSPTLTAQMTQAGVILGTAAYMSPEQARGQEVDKQTDIWAFGVVLYELLAGRRPFGGQTMTDTLAAILEREPDWETIPEATPPLARSVIRRCLEKDPKRRLHDIADARIELEDALQEGEHASSSSPRSVSTPRRPQWRLPLLWGLTGAVAGALVVALLSPGGPQGSPERHGAMRSSIPLDVTAPLAVGKGAGHDVVGPAMAPQVALSQDGHHLAYVVLEEGVRRIRVRQMETGEVASIPGSNGAQTVFFSPDGLWLGFVSGNVLRKVFLERGDPVPISELEGGILSRLSWGWDGTIYVRDGPKLVGIDADSGVKKVISEAPGLADPHLLPGERVLIASRRGRGGIVAIDLASDELTELLEVGRQPVYLDPGYLIYGRPGGLMAVGFDSERLQIIGSPVPVLEGIWTGVFDTAHYAVSEDGHLVYVPGRSATETELVWVDLGGKVTPLGFQAADHQWPRLSPDGGRLAIPIQGHRLVTWIFDLERQTRRRLVAPGAHNDAVWSGDGTVVVSSYSSSEKLFELLELSTDGSGSARSLPVGKEAMWPFAVSPDGRVLAYQGTATDTTRSPDIWTLDLQSGSGGKPFVTSQAQAWGASFSADGRWLAYSSGDTGECYVVPFPAGTPATQVSYGGAFVVLWSPVRNELYYQQGRQMMAVEYTTEPVFRVGKQRILFERDFADINGASYDLHPDGERFLMLEPVEQARPDHLELVVNWSSEVERLIPREGR